MMNVKEITRVGLFVKPHDQRVIPFARQLISYLIKRFESVVIDEESYVPLAEPSDRCTPVSRQDLAGACDLVIALGGDGTLLAAARTIARKKIPLIGVNLGALGFLVEIPPNDMERELDRILDGHYRLERRPMLTTRYIRGGKAFKRYDACNDIVIKHRNTARMIELKTCIDNVPVSRLWSDGLIVSTPTGSTAYALSCDGPLVEPTLEATLVVPICPHTLSQRPLIIDSHKTIQIEYTGKNEELGLVSVDGQINEVLQPNDSIIIRALPYKLQLVQPLSHNYFLTLKTKLRWSEQI